MSRLGNPHRKRNMKKDILKGLGQIALLAALGVALLSLLAAGTIDKIAYAPTYSSQTNLTGDLIVSNAMTLNGTRKTTCQELRQEVT